MKTESNYPQASEGEKLFDVTQVVGSVYGGGNMPPRHAAFLIIAGCDEGTYSFPVDGNIVSVTVEHSKPS